MKSVNIFKSLLTSLTNIAGVAAMIAFKQFNILGEGQNREIRASALDLFINRSGEFPFLGLFSALALSLTVASLISFLIKKYKAGVLLSCLITVCETAVVFLVIFGLASKNGGYIFVNGGVFLPLILSFASCLLPLSLFPKKW